MWKWLAIIGIGLLVAAWTHGSATVVGFITGTGPTDILQTDGGVNITAN
jgi:hypothetical protein